MKTSIYPGRRALALVFVLAILVLARPAVGQTQAELVGRAGFQALRSPIPIRDFNLANLEGGTVKLSDFKGKVVFLNFWASWCPPCRAEMPSMQKLHEEFGGSGLVILGVNLQEDARTVGNFVKKEGYRFPIVLDESGAVGAAYGVRAMPTSYLIDKDGMIIGGLVGSRDWYTREIRSAFKTLLSQ